MTISRGQIYRELKNKGGIMEVAPRQGAFFGGLKKAVSGVLGSAKDLLKSPLGKAALLYGGSKLLPMAFGQLGKAGGISELFSKGLSTLGLDVAKGGKPTFGQFSKVFGIGALGGAALEALTAAGLDTDNPNSMPRDVDSLKSYLKQGYLQLNPDKTAKDAEAFAEANTTEYKANGGRIGFANGMPKEGIETLLPKQKPSSMMQGVDKTIQSIDNFAQLIAQSGDPSSFRGHVDLLSEFIQKNDIDPSAAFDYVKRRVDEIKPGLSKFIFTTTEDMPVEKKAYGGRIGYEIGGPAYDATDASIYGSSAITVTPDTIMGPGGNQIQDKMGKPGIVSPITGMPVPYGGYEAVGKPYIPPKTPISMQTPLPGSGGISEIDIPVAGGNNNQMGILPVMPVNQLPGFRDDTNEKIFTKQPVEGAGEVVGRPPTQPNMSDEDIMKGFAEYQKQNPDIMNRPGTMAIVNLTLPGGTPMSFRSGAGAAALRQYLQSIGMEAGPGKGPFEPLKKAVQPGGTLAALASGGRAGYSGGTKGPDDLYTRSYKRVMELMDEGYDFGSAVKKYMEEEKERENKAYGGRIGYDGGTDFQKWLEGKQKFDQGQNAEQLYREYLEELRRKKVMEQKTMAANGGRIGYAFGNPEQNAMEAAGIEGLPLNQNPAGVKELDLRDSGGFIPPVGVKEKADDIPAMLSNNEFVFTADAVRGMGDGDVNKGAQRMYDMMKKLEGGGRV